MHRGRYLNAILTVIALELLWLGLMHNAPPVSAQGAPTPVIVRGIQIDPNLGTYLPVAVVGQYRRVPDPATAVLQSSSTHVDGTVMIQAAPALKVEIDRPVRIDTQQPLLVRQVDYTPRQRPGE